MNWGGGAHITFTPDWQRRSCNAASYLMDLMALVNGRDDVQNAIEDIYLSLDHGDPKAARIFDGGHMGEGPVVPTIGAWLDAQLT